MGAFDKCCKIDTADITKVSAELTEFVIPNNRGLNYWMEYVHNNLFTTNTITDITHAELKVLHDAGTMEKGMMYKITDFATIYERPDYTDADTPVVTPTVVTAATEPIVVTATSASTLAQLAFQPTYETDIVYYELDYTTPITSTPTKGRILKRIDTEKNIECNWDWRTIQWIRYLDADGDLSYWNTGLASSLHYTFSGYAVNVKILDSEGVAEGLGEDFDLPNIVYSDDVADVVVLGTVENVTFQGFISGFNSKYRLVKFLCTSNAFNCEFNNVYNVSIKSSGSITSNFVDVFQNTTIVTTTFQYNNITSFTGSTINATNINTNNIKSLSTLTILGASSFINNNVDTIANTTLNSNFAYNKFILINGCNLQSFTYNKGSNFTSNTITGACSSNDFGNVTSSNTIGLNFGVVSPNVFTNGITGSTIGDDMYGNIVDKEVDSCTIGNNFRHNTIKTELQTVDFTSATHVYGDYNCELIKNSTGVNRLFYYDSFDSRQTTNIDA